MGLLLDGALGGLKPDMKDGGSIMICTSLNCFSAVSLSSSVPWECLSG